MIRVAILLTALVGVCLAQGIGGNAGVGGKAGFGGSPWGVLQSAKCSSGTSCSMTLTPLGTGHAFYIACFTYYTYTLTAPTSTGLSFTVANASYSDSSGTSGTSASWYVDNVSVASHTVSCNFSNNASGFNRGMMVEMNCPLGCILDKTPATLAGFNATLVCNATGTLSTFPEVVIGNAQKNNSSETITASVPWVVPANATAGGAALEWQVVGSTSSVTCTFATSIADYYIAQAATFE